jgi:hypothetical protein
LPELVPEISTNSVNTNAAKAKKIGMIFQHTLKRLAIVEEDLFVVLLLVLAV